MRRVGKICEEWKKDVWRVGKDVQSVGEDVWRVSEMCGEWSEV